MQVKELKTNKSEHKQQTNKQTERRFVTMLFSDIVGFTSISELIGNKTLIKLMKDYYFEMQQIIEQHNGAGGEFIGDGMLAFWNTPLNIPDHATKAVLSALMMKERLIEMNEIWKKKFKNDQFPNVSMRIGIHR